MIPCMAQLPLLCIVCALPDPDVYVDIVLVLFIYNYLTKIWFFPQSYGNVAQTSSCTGVFRSQSALYVCLVLIGVRVVVLWLDKSITGMTSPA
jgi:hypothetical protein